MAKGFQLADWNKISKMSLEELAELFAREEHEFAMMDEQEKKRKGPEIIRQAQERLKKDVEDTFSLMEAHAEKTMSSEGWAISWDDLEVKYPPDFPNDILPDSIIKARKTRHALMMARDGLTLNDPFIAVSSALVLCTHFCYSYNDGLEKLVRKQLSEKANAVKSDKKEKLYISALIMAKRLANDNVTWNNVQIAEELIRAESFKPLSLRELKKRVLELFPDRNHRKNSK